MKVREEAILTDLMMMFSCDKKTALPG